MSKDIYIIPFFGNWAVTQDGKNTPISFHNRKDEAIKVGTQLTKRLKSKLIVRETI